MTPNTPEELEELLYNQVVLTLQNDGNVYRDLIRNIEGFCYDTFRQRLINNSDLTKLTRPLGISPKLTPQRRCVVMLWDSYMRDHKDWRQMAAGVEKYAADTTEIAEQNKRLSEAKLTVEILHNPSLDPGPGKMRINHVEAKELGDKAEFYSNLFQVWKPCDAVTCDSGYAYRTDASATAAVKLHDPDRPAPAGYLRIDHKQAAKLRLSANYHSEANNLWKPADCKPATWRPTDWHHDFKPDYAYCAPIDEVLRAFPNHPVNQPETSKEITMSQVNFDSSVPVATVTLIYGQPVSSYSERDLLAAVRKLDANIETYSKMAGSERIAKSIAAMKAEREAIIKAFDAAA